MNLEAKVMEIIEDFQQQLDKKESQITELTKQLQKNHTSIQSFTAEIKQLREELQKQTTESQVQKVQAAGHQKEPNEKTATLTNHVEQIESNLKVYHGKQQETMGLLQSPMNSIRDHEFDTTAYPLSVNTRNANETHESTHRIDDGDKMVRYVATSLCCRGISFTILCH